MDEWVFTIELCVLTVAIAADRGWLVWAVWSVRAIGRTVRRRWRRG